MADVFRSDKILTTILEKLTGCAKLRGYNVSMESISTQRYLPLYSTKLMLFLDVMSNALHIDPNDTTIHSVLSSPDYYIDQALHYFIEVRSISKPETCWIYIEFDDRSAYLYMAVRNTNVEERLDQDGDVIGYINLLDHH